MIGEIVEYLSVFIASALNLNYGLGLSVTYQLSSFELFLLLSTGSIFGVAACLVLGAQLREWWRRRFHASHASDEQRPSFVLQIWRRYGLLGLAFLTFLIGPVPPVAIALISGMKKEMIFMYLSVGKFFWSGVFAFIGYGHIQKVLAMIIQ